MFRRSSRRRELFTTSNLLPDEKRKQLERDWPGRFRDRALPLINEELFRHLYYPDNGRPNKPIALVVGVLVLKEMFDLTDEETLGRVDYDLRRHVALDLRPEDARVCRKTLHNFRRNYLEMKRRNVFLRR